MVSFRGKQPILFSCLPFFLFSLSSPSNTLVLILLPISLGSKSCAVKRASESPYPPCKRASESRDPTSPEARHACKPLSSTTRIAPLVSPNSHHFTEFACLHIFNTHIHDLVVQPLTLKLLCVCVSWVGVNIMYIYSKIHTYSHSPPWILGACGARREPVGGAVSGPRATI